MLQSWSKSGKGNLSWRGENANLHKRPTTFGNTGVTIGRHVSTLVIVLG